MSYRFWRPISSTSRKPAVVTKAVRAPLRSRMALVAIVVAWMTADTSAKESSPAAILSLSVASTPCAGSVVVGTFQIRVRPVAVSWST